MPLTTFLFTSSKKHAQLPSENEIALANIVMRKQADDEHRKALKVRKAMPDLTNVVDEGVVLAGAIAKPMHKKGTSKKRKENIFLLLALK